MNLLLSLSHVLDYRSTSTKALLVGSLLSLTMPLCLKAHVVTPKEAENIARKYIKLPTKKATRGVPKQSGYSQNAPYYIYNDAQNKGFVIVSGNTDMGEILAYSNENALDTTNLHPGLAQLLNSYKMAFKAISTNNAVETEAKKGAFFAKTVAPLLKTTWSQDAPYNALIGYKYTGCVATTLSQILKYHEWPVQGMGKVSYVNVSDNRTLSANLNLSHYDWANMLPSYDASAHPNQTQRNAIAKLMNDVGLAARMQYHPGYAVATNQAAFDAFVNHFDYQATSVYQTTEGSSVFADLLRQELLDGFPFYFYGATKDNKGAHAWVLDGFDDKGFFHMNFGWNGQSDGYYSLTALSVLKAGSEFQGRSLSFNRQMKIMVAHPKKPGVAAIDKDLLPESPKLKFNEGGYITIKNTTQRTFRQSETLPVSYANFVNIGKPFKGDIGIAVLDNADNVVKEFYSDHHNTGGFTHSIYADYGDLMGTDHLIANAQTIKVKLSDLKDGYYTLKPVCYQRNDAGEFEALTFMKTAPNMEVEISKGKVRVSKECNSTATYQLIQHLDAAKELEQGTTAKIQLLVQNLNSLPKTAFAKIKLIDQNNKVALEITHQKAVEFDGFETLDLPFSLNIPADFAIGTYSVEVEMLNSLNPEEGEEARNNVVKVNKVHGNEATTVVVSKAKATPLMSSCNVFFAESSDTKLIVNELLFSRYPLFKLIVDLKTFSTKSYNGPIELFFEDISTKERIAIAANKGAVMVNSDYNFEFYSYWLRPSTLGIEENKTYKLVVLGTIDGVKTDLWNNKLPSYFFVKTSELLTMSKSIPTSINSSSINNASLQLFYNNKELKLEGRNLQWIELYSLSGELLKKVPLGGNSEAIVSLDEAKAGVYIAKIQANGTTFVRKVLVR